MTAAGIVWRDAPQRPELSPDAALAYLRDAVARQPGHPGLRLALSRLLLERGHYDEIDAVLAADATPDAAHVRGWAALERGEHDRAIAAFEALRDEGGLATALSRAGKLDEAAKLACEGLAQRPTDRTCARIAGIALLALGRAQEAYDAARAAWMAGGRNAQLVWVRAAASRALRREAEFAALTARAPWFATARIAIDNDALAREILENRALGAPDAFRPARGDLRRVDGLESANGPMVRALHAMVRAAIEDYRQGRLGHVRHPLIDAWPATMVLESWALAMRADGFEDWHIHAGAWLSAVYYVRNPARTTEGDAGRLGFGALPEMTGALAIESWTVTPEPGLLVLFPAWYAHRTWPTGRADAQRISVAFNASRA